MKTRLSPNDFVSFLFVMVICLVATSTEACRISVYGNPKHKENADIVVSGIVTGVRLIQHEKSLAWKYIPEAKRDEDIEPPISVVGGNDQHLVHVVVTEVERGAAQLGEVIELKIFGCGIRVPELKDSGKFYLTSETGFVLPVYDR